MATKQSSASSSHLNRSMLTTGAVLTGLGAMLAFTGTVIVASALASAGRDWMRELETPPVELAHRAMHQAKAASQAGWEAWRTEAHHNGV